MLWATLVLIILCGFGNTQEFDNSSNETEDISCIEHYNDLEMYIMNNKTLMEELAETFFTSRRGPFTTGRGASDFVKITYNFQTRNGKQSKEGTTTNCSVQQTKFIWAEAIFYLLGPKALYWFTLFATNLDEVEVTVELPCLCSDDNFKLLSRLTYLIKVYAASKYHDHPLQYANGFYFQAKGDLAGESFRTTIIVMMFIMVTLTYAVTPLTILYIYPIVVRLVTSIEDNPGKIHYYKLIRRIPVTFTSVGICMSFLAIHLFSVGRFIQYGDEVLGSQKYTNKMPIIHAILSAGMIAIGIILSVVILAIRITKSKGSTESQRNDDRQWTLMLPAVVISINIIYIGCYFLPYMLLAFITNPFLTFFIYLMLALFFCCIYLICLGACYLYEFFKEKKYENLESDKKYENLKSGRVIIKFLYTLLYSCMAWAIAFSVITFLFIITFIITLGRLADFEELNNLAPSLVIAAIGYFLLKPPYRYLTKENEDENSKSNNTSEQQGEGTTEQNLTTSENNSTPNENQIRNYF